MIVMVLILVGVGSFFAGIFIGMWLMMEPGKKGQNEKTAHVQKSQNPSA